MRDTAKPAIPWVMVETLARDTMSVVTVGGQPRGFAGALRVVQRTLARNPSLYDGLNTARLIEILCDVRDNASHVYQEVQTASGPHKLIVRPVLGPDAGVHAVQFWIGPAAAGVPPPRRAVGAVWGLDRQQIHYPATMSQLCGLPPGGMPTELSIAELFHMATEFDRHGELIRLLYELEPGDKVQFDLTLRHRPEASKQWRVAVRARDDGTARWLWEDVTSDAAVPTRPTLERIALREAHRRAGTCLAVLHLAHAGIAHWLTDPADWIEWTGLSRPVDVFHPEDRPRLRALADRMSGDAAIDVTVRTLTHEKIYLPTELLLYPYPDPANRRLAVAQFAKPESTPASAEIRLPTAACLRV